MTFAVEVEVKSTQDSKAISFFWRQSNSIVHKSMCIEIEKHGMLLSKISKTNRATNMFEVHPTYYGIAIVKYESIFTCSLSLSSIFSIILLNTRMKDATKQFN